VKLVEDLGIPELSSKQIEEACIIAEEAARKYIHSKVPKKMVETLNISAELEGTKPANLKVEVEINLSPLGRNSDVQKLASEAVNEAFKSTEKYLRELACHSQK
jgi:histone H3/H4